MTIFSYAPLLLAGIIGFVITLTELITSTYPRTYPLLLTKSWKLYIYSLIYGAISFVLMLCMMFLFDTEIIKLGEVGVYNIWILAILVGMTTKAFLHVRFFSATIGSASIPVGIETAVLLFEPWFLNEIKLDEFFTIRGHIDKCNNHFTDLDEIKQKIENNMPIDMSSGDRAIFLLGLENLRTISESMELYLRTFGIKNFDRIFPQPNSK